jgi:general secretion pathway protein D
MAKLPGAAELPVLGRLFRNNDQTVAKTEIVLLVTPRVLRNVRRPETVESQFASGTEAVPGRVPLRFRDGTAMGLTPPGAAVTATPAGRAAAAAAPAPEAPAALSVQVPAQVGIGEEFSVQLALPDGNQAITTRVQLRYDPALLTPVGGTADASVELSSSGMAGVATPPATVRLRVLAKAPVQAEIGFDVASANLPVQAPPPVQVGIVQR